MHGVLPSGILADGKDTPKGVEKSQEGAAGPLRRGQRRSESRCEGVVGKLSRSGVAEGVKPFALPGSSRGVLQMSWLDWLVLAAHASLMLRVEVDVSANGADNSNVGRVGYCRGIRTNTSGKQLNTPRPAGGAWSRRADRLIFGASSLVVPGGAAGVLFTFMARPASRRTTRGTFATPSMIARTVETNMESDRCRSSAKVGR